jgi:hypothetical protein
MMNAGNKAVRGPEFVSIRDAAWVLGVDQPVVCRAIRHGVLPLARRRGRDGVPAAALARLLCPAGGEHEACGRDPGDDGGGGAGSGRPGGGA